LNESRRLSNIFGFVAVGALVLFNLSIPIADATSIPSALVIADYAVATASHERPAHAVNANDVSNAVATTRVNSTNLVLVSDLREIPQYPQLVVLLSSTLYKSTCVYFPNKVDGTPKIAVCPPDALAFAAEASTLLDFSRNVIAVAASYGRAVSGANIASAARAQRERLSGNPGFEAGVGGTVKFDERVSTGTSDSATLIFCVLFPKTAYGIPVMVNC